MVADLQGPKIRIGNLTAQRIALPTGGQLTLDNLNTPGDARRVPVSLHEITRYARRGDPLLLGDGTIELRVTAVRTGEIQADIVHGGMLTSHAGLYLPHAKLRTEILGRKDLDDLDDALRGGIDYVAVSFVRDASDLVVARRAIDRRAPTTRAGKVGLIAKIERAEALANIDGIIAEADAIMVARGDLGIEVPLERLAVEQKDLIRRSNAAGKPVIVATQMLLSMVSSPRPTRAEATDVANAVLDGADAVMLSEESAVGQFPVECVEWLSRIAEATEVTLDRVRFDLVPGRHRSEATVARSAVRLAEEMDASAIVTPTHSGRTARLVSRHRPRMPIWAFTSSPDVRAQLALVWGVRSFPAPAHQDLGELRAHAIRVARDSGLRTGVLALTAGFPVEGRPTNLVTLVELGAAGSGSRAQDPPRAGARRGAAAAGRLA